jgi:hypothetical protein
MISSKPTSQQFAPTLFVAEMAADPQVQSVSRAIVQDFTIADADGIEFQPATAQSTPTKNPES